MGDLVHSERAQSPAALHGLFNAAVDDANREYAAVLASPLTITLGDEFQGLTDSWTPALMVMRHVRWRLLEQQVGCRFVVGAVTLATPLNRERAWNMMGPGLATARAKLAQKRALSAYRFSLPDRPALERLLDGLGAALSDIERDWTVRQRQVALASLQEGGTAAALAVRFSISEAVLYKIRRSAKFELYQSLWSALNAAAEADMRC